MKTDENSEQKLKQLVSQNKFSEAIYLAEQAILQNQIPDFTKAVGKSLLHLTDDLVRFIEQFFSAANQEIKVESMYAEMNGFTINYDLWFVELFAFNSNQGLENPDWLADYSYSSDENPFEITEFEAIQSVYEDYMDNEKWENEKLEDAANECATLIVLRLQELFNAAKESARVQGMAWAGIPIYVAAHDAIFDAIYQA